MLDGVAEALDDAAARHVPATNRAMLKDARRHWKNFKAVERSIGPDMETLSGSKLVSYWRKNQPGFARGRSVNPDEKEFKDFALFAARNKHIVGSPTAEKQAGSLSELTAHARAGAAGASMSHLGYTPPEVIAAALATYPLGVAYKRARNNVYFSNLASKAEMLPGIASGSPQLAQNIQRLSGLLGGGAALPASGSASGLLSQVLE